MNLFEDARYGWRTLLKDRALAAMALLTLAVGIGANTAMFSVVNTARLRPLAFANPVTALLANYIP